MNGRIYEPTLGRMLSPDPVTQAPNNGQNYNRYSYAFNNPLKYSDPSGYCGTDGTLNLGYCGGYEFFSPIPPQDDFLGPGGGLEDPSDFQPNTGGQSPTGPNACTGGLSLGAPCSSVGDVFNWSEELVVNEPVSTEGQYTSLDFVANYFGDADDIDLGDVGLGDEFEAHSQVVATIEYVRNEVEISVRKGGSGNVSGTRTIINTAGFNVINPLYSVGSTALNYSTSCTSGSCTASFGFVDSFSDPFGRAHRRGGKPYELPGGRPYALTYNFTRRWNFSFGD